MAMGVSGAFVTTTVPRKRRPRAVGEVYITSQSSIFLSDEVSNQFENFDEDPVYENTICCPVVPPRTKDKHRHIKPESFTVFRVLEDDDKFGNITPTLDDNAKWDLQTISVYIGETIKFNYT